MVSFEREAHMKIGMMILAGLIALSAQAKLVCTDAENTGSTGKKLELVQQEDGAYQVILTKSGIVESSPATLTNSTHVGGLSNYEYSISKMPDALLQVQITQESSPYGACGRRWCPQEDFFSYEAFLKTAAGQDHFNCVSE